MSGSKFDVNRLKIALYQEYAPLFREAEELKRCAEMTCERAMAGKAFIVAVQIEYALDAIVGDDADFVRANEMGQRSLVLGLKGIVLATRRALLRAKLL